MKFAGKKQLESYIMFDKHGRRMRKLRISLLDACNLRCLYCMPENPTFMPRGDWASVDKLVEITKNLVDMGIEEIRLTGGEPTLRSDLVQVAQEVSVIGAQKIGLTTNALILEPLLTGLAETQVRYLNISLDSLNSDNFQRITRREGFEKVISAILRAKEMGFVVKVNVVVMCGLNDHEILEFANWSAKYNIPVRFLESMNIGVMKGQFEKSYMPASEMHSILERKYTLRPVKDAIDSTSRNYILSNGARIGFITSESKPFCSGCSRLRLTPKGHIRPCLFMKEGIDLKPLKKEQYPEALQKVINMKPMGRIPHQPQEMYKIGG